MEAWRSERTCLWNNSRRQWRTGSGGRATCRRMRVYGLGRVRCFAVELPDSADTLADHRLARFAMEGFAEFGHVGDDSVGAIFFGGVRVDSGTEALVFVPVIGAPALSVADEQSLSGRQVVGRIKLLIF